MKRGGLIYTGSLKLSLLLLLWFSLSLGVLGSGCFVGFFIECDNDFHCSSDEFCDFDGVCTFVDTCFNDCFFFDKAAEGSTETAPAMQEPTPAEE